MVGLYSVTAGDDAKRILRDGFSHQDAAYESDWRRPGPKVWLESWPGTFDPRQRACFAVYLPMKVAYIAHLEPALAPASVWCVHPADMNRYCDIRQLTEAEATRAMLRHWERNDR